VYRRTYKYESRHTLVRNDRDSNDFIGGLSLCYDQQIMSRVINIWADVI
jgi:hypothetical protein